MAIKRTSAVVPGLKPTNTSSSPVMYGVRRGVVPKQERLSVQDIMDYSTPEGASKANDEMRRLNFGMNAIKDKLKELAGDNPNGSTTNPIAAGTVINNTTNNNNNNGDDSTGGDSGGDTDIVTGKEWALTVKVENYNGGAVVPDKKVVQCLSFKDYKPYDNMYRLPSRVRVTRRDLESDLKTIPDGEQMDIEIEVRDEIGNIFGYDVAKIKRSGEFDEICTIYLDGEFEYGLHGQYGKYYGTNLSGERGFFLLPQGDKTYRHQQSEPATEWLINHNLGKYPNVVIEYSAGNVGSCGVEYIDENNLKCTFRYQKSGIAILN